MISQRDNRCKWCHFLDGLSWLANLKNLSHKINKDFVFVKHIFLLFWISLISGEMNVGPECHDKKGLFRLHCAGYISPI